MEDRNTGKTGQGPMTKGVEMLLGDPKRAIVKMAVPMIIAMAVHTIYNVADAFWVSGLGANELAAVGFFFPFFFMAMALAGGLGIGGGAAISRRIGAGDKKGADNVAEHTLIIMVIVSLIFTIPLYIFSWQIFEAVGAGDVTGLAVSYGRILFGGALIIFFANVANAILRAEGDTKRAMYAMILGSGLNIILDPLFIYGFDMGIAGAAWATLLSFAVTSALLFYWLFFKKDTYVSFRFRDFSLRFDILKDIMKVGIPASLAQISMAVLMLEMIGIVVTVGGTDGVAVFWTGWGIFSMGMLPNMGIAAALTSVAGATYGAGAYGKLRTAYRFSINFGLKIMIGTTIVTFLFAGPIASAFTWSEGASHLRGDLTIFLRIMSLTYFFVTFGMLSGATFQGIGKGFSSLVITILRTIVLIVTFGYLLGIVLGFGLVGVWFEIAIGNLIGGGLAFTWVHLHLARLGRKGHG